MEEEEIQNGHEEMTGKSASQLMRELLRLIFVLIWKFIVWLWMETLE